MKETTKRKLLIFGLLFSLLIVLFLLILTTAVPIFVRKFLIPQIEKSTNSSISCEIRKIGFFRSEINDLRVAKKDKELFEIDQFRSRHLFYGLLGVSELKISGLRIRLDRLQKANLEAKSVLEEDSKQFTFLKYSEIRNALMSLRSSLKDFSNSINSSRGGRLGSAVFQVRGGQIYFLDNAGERKMIPFSAEIKFNSSGDIISGKIYCEAFSGEFNLNAAINDNAEISLKSHGADISVVQLSDNFYGKLGYQFDAKASPLSLKTALSCEIRNFKFEDKIIKISSGEDALSFSFDFRDDNVDFVVSGLHIEKPVNLVLSVNSENVQLLEDKMEASAKFAISVPKDAKFAEGIDLREVEIPVDINLIWDNEEIKITAKTEMDKISLAGNFSNWNFSSDISDFNAEIRLKEQISADASLKISEISLLSEDKILNIPQIGISCEFRDKQLHISANFADGVFRKEQLIVSKISAFANFADLFDAEKNELKVDCADITFGGKKYGSLGMSGNFDFKTANMQGGFELSEGGTSFPLQFSMDLNEPKRIFFKASSGGDFVKLKLNNLGIFADAMSGYSFEGELNFDYVYEGRGAFVFGGFSKDIRDGSLRNSEKGISIEGINSSFCSDDPFLRRSMPAQRLKIRKLAFGKTELNAIDLIYALEKPSVIFIENLGAEWCGGKVYLASARIDNSPKKSFTLQFDRIILARLLEQFGVGNASGDGRVNGRIPIVFDGWKIDFQDGFFYSTPGVGGNIKVGQAASFLDNLPKDGGQFASIDLTLEALKDFDYDWSKISLKNEGEELLAKFEFLGRPKKPLPFRYVQDKGGFVRVDADAQGSVFKEIKLDLNCRLPLNEIMRYINIFKNFLTEKGIKL